MELASVDGYRGVVNLDVEWVATDPQAWARAFGLIPVKLFGPNAPITDSAESATVLLDGRDTSMLLVVGDHGILDSAKSWAWSANVQSLLSIDASRGAAFSWRSGSASQRTFDPPETIQQAALFFEEPASRENADVVRHVLRTFRRVRDAVIVEADELAALRVFNSIIQVAEQIEAGHQELADIGPELTTSHIKEIIPEGALTDFPSDIVLGDVLTALLRVRGADVRLQPSVLIRHALGTLYQEAHLAIERSLQPYLPGLAPGDPAKGYLRRDVRFTPPALARSLALQALQRTKDVTRPITVLDPACGSGVFLIEAVRELEALGYQEEINLIGYDVSDIACEMAQFAVERAAQQTSLANAVRVSILRTNALKEPWPDVNVILMNPPFVPWERLEDEDRQVALDVLGPGHGRADLSMAFISKAVESLQPAGALATVLPAPLLSGSSARRWRGDLHEALRIELVGRFQSLRYFRSSIVEPGFIVAVRKTPMEPAQESLNVLVAEPEYEEVALRAVRLGPQSDYPTVGFEYSEKPADFLEQHSWKPMPRGFVSLVRKLSSMIPTRVESLFAVQQGIRTGADAVFKRTAEQVKALPRNERKYFRLMATNKTIRLGRIAETEFIFYPYGEAGLILKTEDELREAVPSYYEEVLKPNRVMLGKRAGVDPDRWWTLTRPRASQFAASPKIVSKTFGKAGGFAYDQKGRYVVQQGHAWLLKQDMLQVVDVTELEFAYLALFNSRMFEMLLKAFCPILLGGQFDLSPQYVNRIPLPYLYDDLQIERHVVLGLAMHGRHIHESGLREDPTYEALAARAFGEEWEGIKGFQLESL
jgi:adenine-specific DNA-methyltransferase